MVYVLYLKKIAYSRPTRDPLTTHPRPTHNLTRDPPTAPSIVPFQHATTPEQGLFVFAWPCVLPAALVRTATTSSSAVADRANGGEDVESVDGVGGVGGRGALMHDGGGELMLLECFAEAVGTGMASLIYEKLKPLITKHGGSSPHMWVGTELTAARPSAASSGNGGGDGDGDGGGGEGSGGSGEGGGWKGGNGDGGVKGGGFAMFGSLTVKADSVTDEVLATFQQAWTREIRAVAELLPGSSELATLNKAMTSHARSLLRSRRKGLSTPPGTVCLL